ncbi:MAG: hypothetical protein ACJ790_09055 [Myxococcaceae bacterium]
MYRFLVPLFLIAATAHAQSLTPNRYVLVVAQANGDEISSRMPAIELVGNTFRIGSQTGHWTYFDNALALDGYYAQSWGAATTDENRSFLHFSYVRGGVTWDLWYLPEGFVVEGRKQALERILQFQNQLALTAQASRSQ